jgi:phosphate/sulfate permease
VSPDVSAPPKFPTILALAFLAVIGIIAITGLVAPFAITSDLSARGISISNLLPVLILSPIITFGIVLLLIWLMLRLIKMYQHPNGQAETKSEAKQPTQPQIAAPPEMVMSVTEHTTRNFEPVENIIKSRDPKKKVTR